MWPFRSKRAPQPPASQRRALSFLLPEQVKELGQLPGEAIMGFLTDSDGEFEPNPAFIALMHDTIRRVIPQSEDMIRCAAEQGEGWAYVIDARTPEGANGRVPPEDIIGGFEVKGGLLTGTYWANDRHLLMTGNGMVHLVDSVLQAMAKTVRDRVAVRSAG